MDTIRFYKYQGAGNDFIIPDPEQNHKIKDNTKLIEWLCDRRFGIGGDGLILLEPLEKELFYMTYYNADGKESTLCGNGGRCISAFAFQFRQHPASMRFMAIDGPHEAEVEMNDTDRSYWVRLQMPDVSEVIRKEGALWMNTGSPHHIELVEDIDHFEVEKRGREIRNEVYGKEGSNVNFVEALDTNEFAIRTYERGVEGETLACGTGVTAAALAMDYLGLSENNKLRFKTEGGVLEVEFEKEDSGYKNVWLSGPATFVFHGEIQLKKP